MSVRHALLGLLAQRPRHGYELHSAFEALVGGEENWDVKPAQIYTTLLRLQESGFIQEESVIQAGGPEKHIYEITPAGRKVLTDWFTTGVDPEHQRDEFFVKLVLSMASYESEPYQVIWAQRSRIYQELHELTIQRSKVNPATQLAKILLLEKAIMHLEADLRWLEIVETRLDEIKRQPLPEPRLKRRGRPRKEDRLP